jgi:hypothetical protein
MPTPPLPRPHHVCRAAGCLAIALAALTGAASTSADAKLIPPPGPWPTTVTGATNPLIETPFSTNGGNATPNASLRVWLPFGGQRLTAITRAVGQYTVVRGQLRNRDTHRAISGATLTVAVQNVYAPAAWTTLMSTRTNRRGDFRADLGPGYHRRVAILYYPTINSVAPIFSRRLLIRAQSQVALGKPFHQGRTYRFDGQVSAGFVPIPSGGLTIALQVRNRSGRWVSARLARTNALGRFRIRFTFPSATTLAVRVLVPAQNDWALYAGQSRTWVIHP